ncbi:Uncharacterised protein [Mycobacteroides abscessus subsp. abscessus]|nr:Uncharacterised protein [Mycobacteroides abscessus subsp. abscessus]
MAAATGIAAVLGSRSLPATNSSLSSRPTTKKKIASSPSEAQLFTERLSLRDSGPNFVERRLSYQSAAGEFARTIAAAVAASRRMPPTASCLSTRAIVWRRERAGAEESGVAEDIGEVAFAEMG